MKNFGIFLAGTLMCAACHNPQSSDTLLMFTGSYAPADSSGIKCYQFDQQSAQWQLLSEASGVSNPSFITLDGAKGRLYSVGEDDGETSTMNMLTFNSDGSGLKLVATELTQGGAPCHIILSPDGSEVFTANYSGGSISVCDLDSTGQFAGPVRLMQFTGHGPDSVRQAQSHLHQLSFIPETATMLANDLGTDKIYVIPAPYDSVAEEISIAPGAGPRHTVFNSEGTRAYMLTEMSGEVMVFDVDNDQLTLKQTILADTLQARGSADIHLSPDGLFLYASTRLQGDGLAIFRVNVNDGTLQRIAFQPTGKHPRNFAITPNGRYVLVACRDANAIEIYARDSDTGLLSLHSTIPTQRPTCIQFQSK